ncbi:MAG: cold-shock protein [Candidatus Binatia bacterium]
MTGTIKKINRQKGFGFIVPDDGSDDVFFHRGSMAPRAQFEDVNEGDGVQFQVRRGDKGPVAFQLKLR